MVENKDNVPVNKTETKVEETTEVVGTSSESTVNEKKKERRSLILTWVENIVEALIIVVAVVISGFAIANPGGMNEDYSKINVNMLPVLSNSMSGTFEQGDLIFGTKAERDGKGKNTTVYDVGTVAIFVVNDYVNSDMQYLNTHRIIGYSFTHVNPDLGVTYYETLVDDQIKNEKDVLNYFKNNLKDEEEPKIYGYITKGDNNEIYKTTTNEDTYKTNAVHDTYVVPLNNVVGTWNGNKISGVGGVITWIKTPLNFFLVIMIPLILLFGWNVFTVVKYIIDRNKEKAKEAAIAQAKAIELSEAEKEEIKRKAIEEYMKKMQEEASSKNGEENK
jgi:signal peptidase I